MSDWPPPHNMPAGWDWVRLGDVCTLAGDAATPAAQPERVFAHYSMPAFDAGAGPELVPGSAIGSTKTAFPAGAVLLSRLNPRIVRVWHTRGDHAQQCVCSTDFVPLSPDPGRVDACYLTWALQDPALVARLRRAARAATKSRERVRPERILAERVPVPPIPEQRRIATALTEQMAAVERARAAAEAQVDAAKTLPAAWLRELFEGPGAQAWPWRTLGEVARTCSGATPPRGDGRYFGGDIPWVKTAELRDGVIEDTEEHVSEAALRETSMQLLPAGTLLVAMYGQGQTRGRTGLLGRPATSNQACFAILPDASRFSPAFLQLWFRHQYMLLRARSEGRGGNQPNLSGGILRHEMLPLPPVSLQFRLAADLAARIAGAERAAQVLATQAAAVSMLPGSLLRRALSGGL